MPMIDMVPMTPTSAMAKAIGMPENIRARKRRHPIGQLMRQLSDPEREKTCRSVIRPATSVVAEQR